MGTIGKRANNRVEMVGKTYNSWKVLRHSHTTGKIAFYSCECLECSNEFTVDGRNVRQGLSKRCSPCGLKHTNASKHGKTTSKKTPKGIAEYYLKNRMKKGRPGKSLKEWAITDEHFRRLVYGNCQYCGEAPFTTINPTIHQGLAESRQYSCFITYNGIDRVDSSKGYIAGNVVSCCTHCNSAKLDRNVDDYEAWVLKSAEHIKSRK